MKKGSRRQAWHILVRIGGRRNAKTELRSIEAALQEEQGTWKEIFSSGYSRALLIGSLLAMFSQFSGINSIMYYAPEIFKAAGSGTDSAFVQTVTIGAVNLIFTFVAIMFVDKAGRKPLLIAGTAVQAISLSLVGYFFQSGREGWPLLIGILSFTAAFAMALGPISWIVNSEIFPTKLRGRAMGLTTFLLWLACYLVSQTFPMLVDSIGPAQTFWLYALSSLITMVFVITMVPETKGRTLEEIEASWRR
jgi:SP family arabinose:H+ symporter-like MFS transporter